MIQKFFSPLFIALLVVSIQHKVVAQDARGNGITIFAAASLNEVFAAMAEKYRSENPGEEITFNFAGSQQLVQQIAEGAAVDIFASANMRQMNDALNTGRVDSASVRVFAHNTLVVVFPKENEAGIHTLSDLGRPHLKIILADKTVPAGEYSVEVLEKCIKRPGFDSTFKQNVLQNVVSYEENVKAVLSKIVLGEGDAGIVYTSDVSRDAREKVGTIEIPEPLNVVAEYPICLMRTAPSRERSRRFVQFILSDEGQSILTRFGFLRVK
ncbi:MAG TPA: molybdate ABC transporter substrate-binding protein [Bacteroidota bacterium]|nr:molybdate ABC transporter substrate-binding protein [Bacteroidota bacterium]